MFGELEMTLSDGFVHVRIVPMYLHNRASLVNFSQRRFGEGLHKLFPYTFRAKDRMRVGFHEVCDPNAITKLVRHYFPEQGRFQIWVWNVRHKSKTFNPKSFRCRKEKCPYHPDTIIGTDHQRGRCKLWTRHTKGMKCLLNRPFKPNWECYAEFDLVDLEDGSGYEIKWHEWRNKMHNFPFWKGSKHQRYVKDEEYVPEAEKNGEKEKSELLEEHERDEESGVGIVDPEGQQETRKEKPVKWWEQEFRNIRRWNEG